MASPQGIEIDRLLMNNDRQCSRSNKHLETSLYLKASELEAASLALLEGNGRMLVPAYDVRHTFYGMFPKEEFRYDTLQEKIAALPTIYNEISRNHQFLTGSAPSFNDQSKAAQTQQLQKATSVGSSGPRFANIFSGMNQLQDKVQLASATFPFYPAKITKNFSFADFEQAIMGHYKLSLSCLPPSFYDLPCIHGGKSLGHIAAETYLHSKVLLIAIWRPSCKMSQRMAGHYEHLSRSFPDLITTVHVIVPKYTNEKSYFNSMPDTLPQYMFLDESSCATHDLLGDVPKLPALLMCLPSNVSSATEGGVASLQPQFSVPHGTQAGVSEYYNCHKVLFAMQGSRCISPVAGFAVGALISMYCAAQRPNAYLQHEVSMIVEDPSWSQASLTPSDALYGSAVDAYFYADAVWPGIMESVSEAKETPVLLSPRKINKSGLEPLQQAHYDVVKAMLDSCVGGVREKHSCLEQLMDIARRLPENAPVEVRDIYREKFERYHDLWQSLQDMVAACGPSEGAAQFLPYLFRDRDGQHVATGTAQEAGLSLGMLQHLQKNMLNVVNMAFGGAGIGVNEQIADFLQSKRDRRQLYHIEDVSIGNQMSPSLLSSPGLRIGRSIGNNADNRLEPAWDAVYCNLRLGRYEAAYAIVKDFAPNIGTSLAQTFSAEHTDESTLSHSQSMRSGDTFRGNSRLGSRDRYQRYQRQQLRGKARDTQGRVPQDREALLGHVRVMLQALVVAAGRLNATAALGTPEVRAAVVGIWEHLLEQQHARSTELKEQRYFEHAHRYDVDGSTPGSGGRKRGGTSPGTTGAEPHGQQVPELDAHKHVVLLLLVPSGSGHANNTEAAEALEMSLLDVLQQAEGADLQQQDVLWALMWEQYWGRAFHNAVVQESGRQSVYQGLTPLGCYAQVLAWGGAAYFDPQFADPYGYARVLLCCQQFAAAISHLRRAQQTVPAVHLACVCMHLGLLAPLEPLCDEVEGATQGGTRVVDLLESGCSVASFVEEYAVTDVDPCVSVSYLLLFLVPQCLKPVQTVAFEALVPLRAHLSVFMAALERLHLSLGSFAETRNLLTGFVSRYVRDPALQGALAAGLGRRMLSAHRRIEEAMSFYELAGQLSGDRSGSATAQGMQEVLQEAALQLQAVLLSPHAPKRTYARHAAKSILQRVISMSHAEAETEHAGMNAAHSRHRMLRACGDVANLETFCQLVDVCAELDGTSENRLDVRGSLDKFLQLRWVLSSRESGSASENGDRALETVELVPKAASRMHMALLKQLTSPQARLYGEALSHTASYLQRLLQFVQRGRGGSGSVVGDTATAAELHVFLTQIASVRDSLAVHANTFANNAADIANWVDSSDESRMIQLDLTYGAAPLLQPTWIARSSIAQTHSENKSLTALPIAEAPEYEQAQRELYMTQAEQRRARQFAQLPIVVPLREARIRRGLPDVDSSGYASCVIQCLANVAPLRDMFLTGRYQPVYTVADGSATFATGDEHCLAHRFASLLGHLCSSNLTAALERDWRKFLNSLRLLNHRAFTDDAKPDAATFLKWLLRRLDAELALGRADASLVRQVFAFQRHIECVCEKCGLRSVTNEAYDTGGNFVLYIDRDPQRPPGALPLQDWLHHNSRWETGCARRCTNAACSGMTASQRLSMARDSLPTVLALHLNRECIGKSKDVSAVEFPVGGLDMAPYCSEGGSAVLYDLFAFCNHVDATLHLAYARDSHETRGAWREFHDAHVTDVRVVEDLLTAMQNDNNAHSENYYSGANMSNRDARRDACILFYKKR